MWKMENVSIWGLMGAALASLLSGCSAPSEADAQSVAQGLNVNSPDYYLCALQGSSCVATGAKYLAYGANSAWGYKGINRVYPNSFPCTDQGFGSDPAPGQNKSCWFANLGLSANANGSATVNGEVAYGANGAFTYKQVNGSYTCNNTFFGGDPTPGVVKACYVSLPGYGKVADENGFADICPHNAPCSSNAAAYGANGHFKFKIIPNSSFACNPGVFGGDPAPGVVKSCYLFGAGQGLGVRAQATTVPAPAAGHIWQAWYGSGMNGAFIYREFSTSFGCNDGVFGDPHVGVGKFCFTHQL